MKQVYIGHKERDGSYYVFHSDFFSFCIISHDEIYDSFLFNCYIVFYLIRSTEYAIILIVERICSTSKATKFSKICKY